MAKAQVKVRQERGIGESDSRLFLDEEMNPLWRARKKLVKGTMPSTDDVSPASFQSAVQDKLPDRRVKRDGTKKNVEKQNSIEPGSYESAVREPRFFEATIWLAWRILTIRKV